MREPTLSYRILGDGPPLLLIHGFGVSFNIWRELTPLLAPHFQLILIELPGIGSSPLPAAHISYTESSVAAIESVRQKLGIPKWSLLAYSIGAGVGVAYAAAHPAKTDKLLLLSPPLLRGWRWWGLRSLLWLDKQRPAIGDWMLSGWRLYWLVALIGFNGRPVALTREWVDEIATQPLPALKAVLREYLPAPALLNAIGEETPLLCGQRDFVSVRPPHHRPNVVWFAGDHSGLMQMAQPVAGMAVQMLADRGRS